MKKIFNASLVLVTLAVVCVANLFCACAGETDLREPETIVKTKNVEVPVLIEQDKLVYINQTYNCWFDGKHLAVNGTMAMTADVEHSLPVIEMPVENHKAAEIVSNNELSWKDNNGQQTNGTLNKIESNDGSYELFAALTPAANYSTLTSLHKKVSMITCNYELTGNLLLHTNDGDISNPIDFKMQRPYLLVDPSVDVEIVNHTDTITNIIVKTDTLINTVIVEKHDTLINNVVTEVHDTVTVTNTVTVTDTLTVTVEKFVKGSDVNTVVMNDFGGSIATMTLGERQLLQVTLRHENPILDVEKSVFGNVSFSNTAALKWNGTDTQKTNGTVNAQGCTVNGVEYLRAEYSDISGMKQVRTIYRVWGTYLNENGDTKEFSFEMAPSYLQSYTEVVPQNTEDVIRYEVVDTYKDKTAGDVKVKKLTLKVTKFVNDVETEKWTYVGNVVISGYVAGYDMYVANTNVLRKDYTDAEDFDPTYNYSNRPVTGNEKFSETMSSHIWSYKNFFRAHSGGEVNTNSEIRFQTMVVTFTDGDFSWTSKSFEKNVEVTYDQIDNDSDLQGTTREESGRHFTYGGTHRLTVKNLVDGEEFFTSTAVSPLYVQD